jgi:alcohol dehydrogenase class IV
MSQNFDFSLPTRVLFGNGQFEKGLQTAISTYGKSAVLVSSEGLLSRHRDVLDSVVPTDARFAVSANPTDTDVESIYARIKHAKVDLIIGFGGGSAMDAAKALSFLVGGEIPSIQDYFRNEKQLTQRRLPLVLIPTTSGTGSEVSRGAIIHDTVSGIKKGLRGPAVTPELAIVDPNLSLTAPLALTLETGFDAFTHAVETYVSKKANDWTRVQSRFAVKTIFEALPALARDLHNPELREKMALASCMMGMNLALSSTCLPHRLQYPLANESPASHGRGLAALYPGWIRVTQTKHERFSELADLLNVSSFEKSVQSWMEGLGLLCTIKSLGATSSPQELAAKVEGPVELDPGYESRETIRAIYEANYG